MWLQVYGVCTAIVALHFTVLPTMNVKCSALSRISRIQFPERQVSAFGKVETVVDSVEVWTSLRNRFRRFWNQWLALASTRWRCHWLEGRRRCRSGANTVCVQNRREEWLTTGHNSSRKILKYSFHVDVVLNNLCGVEQVIIKYFWLVFRGPSLLKLSLGELCSIVERENFTEV